MRTITVELPEQLIRECQIIGCQADGQLPYGFWPRAVEYGLRAWLSTKKVPAP